ncbi:MAG TPA: YfhO family protein [Anaerolineales bacterium]|nr:YfhO family protein [Anaerolineales bacterium]
MNAAEVGEKPAKGGASWVMWALALAGPLLLLGPMVVQGDVLFWGTPLLQFTPWHRFAAEVVRGGSVPLWNPYLGAGAPLLANHQSALLYPPNWLLLFIDPAWGHGLLLLLHLLWTAAGMVLLARALGAGPMGQVIAAQAWSMSTFLVSRSGFLSLMAAAAWIPWVLLAAHHLATEASRGLRRRETVRSVLILAVALSLQLLAGHAQTTWYGLLLAAWVTWLASERGRTPWIRSTVALMAGVALAAALAAAQLIPTAEYLLQSSRAAGLDATSAMTYSFWPWRALGLLMPDLFGSPAAGDFWGYGNYWEDALYIGVIPLLMAATAVVHLRRFDPSRRRLVIGLLAACGVAFLFALGSNTPLLPFLYRWVPTFDLFNAPARWNVVTCIGLALLAGLGADLWSAPTARGVYWKRLAIAGSFAMVAVGWIANRTQLDLHASMPRSFGVLGIWLMSAAIVQLQWPSLPDRRWWVVVGLVVAADLYAADIGLVPSTTPRLYAAATDLGKHVKDGHRTYLPADLEYDVKFKRTHRFATFNPGIDWLDVREAGLPNTPMLESIPSLNNFDPLLAAEYSEWVTLLEASPEPRQKQLLALADVGWLGEASGETPPWVEYRAVPDAARARILPAVRWVSGRAEALALLASPDFDPLSTLLLEGRGQEARFPALGGGTGQAEILPQPNPNRVIVRTVAENGGWLLLADAWDPGWAAKLDGETTPLFRADGLFRGIRVPPGEHVVRFDYRPWGFAMGILISAAAWSLVFFLARKH